LRARPTEELSTTSIWVTRWILVTLSIVLAVVLVVRGDVVIGVIVGAIAVSRMVLLVQLRHRRARFRQRRQQGGGPRR
jgi:MFS superfamily sulfate permease-like transporter